MSSPAVVKIYTRPGCGYCAAARELLQQKAVKFADFNVAGDCGLREEMEQLSGGHTVPQIFINDKSIGGYDDMAALEQSGELDRLLGNQQG